ncbi:MAG: DUF6691 family protein [Gammaproteobacteria bacterium]
MKQALARDGMALLAGALFGAGLAVSQMINPHKVQAFLDLAGDWDPSLALTMAGALLVTSVGYRLVLKRSRPLLGDVFSLPSQQVIDPRLLLGAALFGVGWGLGGYCPGPAIAAVALGTLEPWLFLGAMLIGGLLAARLPGANP